MTKPVAMLIGATSKWQSDGRNTRMAHGGNIPDDELPLSARWGVGGAIARGISCRADHEKQA
jgi:hypothetical protein